MIWTDAIVETIVALKAAGYSAAEVGREIGASRGAVIGKWNRLGLATPTKSSITRERRKTQADNPPEERQERTEADGPPSARPAIVGTRDAVVALGRNECRFPHSDPDKPDFHFCGQPTSGTYCAQHHALCYHSESVGIVAWRKRQMERAVGLRKNAA